MRGSTFGRALAAIVIGGLVLRVIYAYAIVRSKPVIGDGFEYAAIAHLIATGHGYAQVGLSLVGKYLPSADKPPLYPYLLAAVSALGGSTWPWHDLIGMVSGAGTIAVVGLIGRRVAGPRAGLIAAGLAAVYAPLIAADGSLRSETVYALLISLVLLAALRLREAPGARRAAVLGALIGLAALARSEALLLILLLPFALAGRRRGAVAALACALVLAPWFIRCWIDFGQPVVISTNVGGLLAGANCDQTYSGPLLGQWSFSCLLNLGQPNNNEAKNANRLRNVGLRYARDHASRLPTVIAARLGRTFELFRPDQQALMEAQYEGRNLTFERIGLGMYYILAVLAIVGGVILRRRRGPLRVLLSPFVLVIFISITAYGFTRLRIAAEPSLIVLAAIAIATGIETRSRARARPLGSQTIHSWGDSRIGVP